MPARRAETPFDTYLQEIQRYPLLTAKEEKALAHRVQEGDLPDRFAAREALVRSNLRLVVSVAKRWRGRGLLLPDLVEEGNVGLLHAAELFDPARETRFSTYATWWIQQAIRRSLVNTVKTVRVPRHLAQELARWRTWGRAFAQREGREATAGEAAKAMKATGKRGRLLSRLYASAAAGGASVSLDVLFEDAQAVDDPRAERPDLLEFTGAERDRLVALVDRLPPRESEIVKMRYGLGDREAPLTLRQIGAALSLSRERVRQLERAAVRRLKEALDR
jgi:RNA polymerase primary sigma factor